MRLNFNQILNYFLPNRCGARAGFMEIVNLDQKVMVELKKLSSAKLCSSVIGQACMGAVVNPPKEGEPSYDLFIKVFKRFVL